jgi:EmrB/QacA subfamily drug resistance transporter
MTREPGSRRWWALGAISLCVLAVSLDGTVLSVALPTLSGALHATESDLEWFASGYLLLLAAGVLPAGLIGDRFGRKRLLLVSLAAFGVGSVLCAGAPSSAVFLAARLLMGLAGAGATVMALSAVAVLFDDAERPKAVGVYQAANFLALPLGPILGGWMLSRFWWGWVFLINVPVVVLGLVVALALVPESRTAERHALDLTGAATSTVGLVVLTYGLIQAGQEGWTHPTALALMACGLVALAGFAAWERRLDRRGGHPMIDVPLFRSPSFSWGAALSGVAGLGMIGLLFVMPQYFQAVRGADALGSGLRLLPLVGGLVAGSLPAGAVVRAIGAKAAVVAGFTLIAAGSLLGTATSTGSSTASVAIWMTVLCGGSGLAFTAATAASVGRLSEERSGIGAAVVQTFQKTAGPFGTALSGSILAAAYRSHLDLADVPPATAATVRSGVAGGVGVAHRLGSTGLADTVRGAFTHGIDVSLLASTAIAAAGLVLTLVFLPTTPVGEHDEIVPEGAAVEQPQPAGRVGRAEQAVTGTEHDRIHGQP